MNQEDKKLFAQSISIGIQYWFEKINQSLYWSTRNEYYSDFYNESNVQDFFKNNLKFLISLKTVNDGLFHEFATRVLEASIRDQTNNAKKVLLLNPNDSYQIKINGDVDLYSLDYFIDENIAIGILRYRSLYSKRESQMLLYKKMIIYALSNDIYKSSNNMLDFIKNKKSCNLVEKNINSLLSHASQVIDVKKDYEHLFNVIFNLHEQGTAHLKDHLYRDNDFLKQVYDCLSDQDKELFIFKSKHIDLVSQSIVSDPNIIPNTYERFKEADFEDINMRYFLSKYYPEKFNKRLKHFMTTKSREICKSSIIIASQFSGITKKMARYIRSESSEKRAYNIFDKIKNTVIDQDNTLELMTQLADTKHDRLLSSVINVAPKDLLYLFISNKLVRANYSYSNQSYSRRNA